MIANPLNTDSTTGRATAYVAEPHFDYVVSGTGLTSRLYSDEEAGVAAAPLTIINAADFLNLQDAVNSVPGLGAIVYVPPGEYTPWSRPAFTPPLVLPNNRPVHLLGAGPRQSILFYGWNIDHLTDPDEDLDLIQVTGDYQTIEGLSIRSRETPDAPEPGAGVGIRIWRSGGNSNLIYRAVVRDCEIVNTQSWAIRVDDSPRNGLAQLAVWCLYDNIEIDGPLSNGGIYVGAGTTTQFFKNCNIKNFYAGYGVYATSAESLSFIDCILEKGTGAPHAYLDTCMNIAFQHSWFEGTLGNTFPYIHSVGLSRGLTIDSCAFRGNSGGANVINSLRAVRIGGCARGVVIRGCDITLPGLLASGVGKNIEIDPPLSGNPPSEVLIDALVVSDSAGRQTPRIEYGSPRTRLSCSSLLWRMPEFTSAELAAIPASETVRGDAVFDTTVGKAVVYDGSSWNALW